jgi:hypothetical protein
MSENTTLSVIPGDTHLFFHSNSGFCETTCFHLIYNVIGSSYSGSFEPFNVVSNMAYIVAAYYSHYFNNHHIDPFLSLLEMSIFNVGVCSTLYHATNW